jgi:hypothetical protein
LDQKYVDGSGVDRRSDRNWAGHECSAYDPANDRHGMQIVTSGNQSLWELVSNVPWVSTKSNFNNWRDWDWTGYHVCDRTMAACRAYAGNAALLEQRKANPQTKTAAWIQECDATLAGGRKHSKKQKKGNIRSMPGGPKDCGWFGTKTLCKTCKVNYDQGTIDTHRQMFPVSVHIPLCSFSIHILIHCLSIAGRNATHPISVHLASCANEKSDSRDRGEASLQ